MASLNSVLEGPRKAGRSSYFDSLFADSESRAAPVEVQATSSALPQPNEGAIAPLLTAEATELGLKFFRCERERERARGARTRRDARAPHLSERARPRALALVARAGITTRPRPAPRPAW